MRNLPARWCGLLLCVVSMFSQAGPVLEKVIDGDTVVIRDDTQTYHLRLLDIDAPELHQAYGKQAKRSLSSLCDTSIIVQPQGMDIYGRTLGRLICHDIDASQHQIEQGMAWFNSRYSKRDDLKWLQVQARQQKTGLWQQARPMPPWIWRKRYGQHYHRQE